MFELDPRLAADSVVIGDLPLCRVLLARDANYPWLILVPRRADVTEIYQLNDADRAQLMAESCRVAEAMAGEFAPTKMNVANLGNVVPQLHIHHVARFEGDAAWPGPIWGAHPAKSYEPEALEAMVSKVKLLLGLS